MTDGNAGRGSKTSGEVITGITPELIREISEKVYAMLLRDLKVEHERRQDRFDHQTSIRSNRPWR
jgi:hypothetical protein